jgi:tetratricopeptide (TPR) repeat protein
MVWLIAAGVVLVLVLVVLHKAPVHLIRTINKAAILACQQNDWGTASNYYREGHEVAGKLLEPRKSKFLWLIELQWASVLHRLGKMREADEMFRSGLAKATVTGRRDDLLIPPAHLDYGDLCTDEGRHCDAERHYRKALEFDERVGNKAMTIFDLQRLGDSLIRQERTQEAEEVIHRAIALETEVVRAQLMRQGRNPSECEIISMSMPDLQFCREQYESARSLYRQKVEYWQSQVTRPSNVDLGHLQMRLAFAEARTGHSAEAIEMYEQAEATFRREWCDGHPKAEHARQAREEISATMMPVRE